MPFQSEKQRKYLWANEPEIAREWTDKYGSRVEKDNGGIMDAWGKHATATEAMKLMNQPDYHQKAGYNFMQNFPNTPQWLANTLATGYQYGSEGFKALKGGTDFSDAMARAKEEARLNRLGIQGLGFDMGEYENFMQNYNTANEISPVGLGDLIQRRSQAGPQAGQRRSGIPRRDTWNVKRRLEGHEDWMGGPLMEYGQYGMPDLNEMYRLAMNEKMRSYGEHETIPNEKYEGLEIQRNYKPTGALPLHIGPYKKHSGSASTEPIYKTVGFNQDGSRFMTKAEYDNLNLDEEETFIDPNRIPGRIQKSVPRKMGILEKFRNRFYKPATSAAGGYNVSQLNKMNALGGYYSEPARQQRRTDARRTNILNRAAKGKAVGNVNALLGKHGYQSTPGGGLQFTGQHEGSSTAGAGYSRSDSGWSSSPFRRGGLASLWQR